MERGQYLLKVLILLCGMFYMIGCSESEPRDEEIEDEKTPSLTVVLTVAGEIQTHDPWTTGAVSVNDWAKPMYRIWFDMNGNIDDGAYGNGAGTRQSEIWLDTGRLGFKWDGTHGGGRLGDEIQHWPLLDDVGEQKKAANDIEAVITGGGKSLMVTLPLEKIGGPETIEVSVMCSPWTTTASDNLGSGAGATPSWIVISDTNQPNSYLEDDAEGDNGWPALSPNLHQNFDLTSLEVRIED